MLSEYPPLLFAANLTEVHISLKPEAFKICLLLMFALPATAQVTREPAEKATESEIEEEEDIEADSGGSLEQFSRVIISIAQPRAPQ